MEEGQGLMYISKYFGIPLNVLNTATKICQNNPICLLNSTSQQPDLLSKFGGIYVGHYTRFLKACWYKSHPFITLKHPQNKVTLLYFTKSLYEVGTEQPS